MNGFKIDEELILSDAQTLGDADTGTDSTNMVKVGGQTGGKTSILVFANTDYEVATGETASIELQAFTADTAASAVSPVTSAHVYGLHKTAADGAIAVDAGDLITEIAIPEYLLSQNAYTWVQLVYLNSEDLQAQSVNAFVRVQP